MKHYKYIRCLNIKCNLNMLLSLNSTKRIELYINFNQDEFKQSLLINYYQFNFVQIVGILHQNNTLCQAVSQCICTLKKIRFSVFFFQYLHFIMDFKAYLLIIFVLFTYTLHRMFLGDVCTDLNNAILLWIYYTL